MDKKHLKKAAWLSAAGTLAAGSAVGVTQGTANASVSYYCEGWNPAHATGASTLESVAKKSIDGMTYPKLSLRWGILSGRSILWTRASTAMEGLLDLDWGASPNNNTHWKCSVTTSYDTANYTTGISPGFYSSAFYFRPCELRISPAADAGNQYNYGPWECGGWFWSP